MKLFLKTAVIGLCLQVCSVIAEPVTVPHTFVPGTPAKSLEVNANIQALATAIQGIKRISLYQDNVKIGKPVLLTLIKLNTDYLVILDKNRGLSTVYLKNGDETLYYSSNNCTGAMYIDKTLTSDLFAGEVGLVAATGDVALSMPLPATATTNFFYNSVKANGVCYDFSAYVVPTVQECIDQMNYGNLNYGWNVHRAKQTDQGGGSYMCEFLAGWQKPAPYLSLDIVPLAYAVQLNNPAVTGITTAACVDNQSRPRVCVPNGELRSE